jgi:O-antigen ligase
MTPSNTWRLTGTWWAGAAALLGGSMLAASLAVVATGVSSKLLFAGLVGVVVVFVGVVTRSFPRLLLMLVILSVQAILFRTFAEIRPSHYGGAATLLITSTMALLAAAYLVSLTEPTFVGDVGAILMRPAVWLAAAPLLSGLLSLVNSPDLLLSFAELFRLAGYFLLFLYVIAKVQTERDVAWVLAGLLGIAAMQGGLGIAQHLARSDFHLDFLGLTPNALERAYGDVATFRVPGSIGHSNIYGPFLALLTGFPLAAWAAYRKIGVRLVCLITLALLCLGVAASVSRGGLGAMLITGLIASVLLVLIFRPPLVTVALGIVAFLVLAGGVWLVSHEEIAVRLRADPLSGRARVEQYGLATTMLAAHPFVGVGLNTYEENVETYRSDPMLIADAPAHGYYALILSETGIFGVAAFAGLIGALFFNAGRALGHPSRVVAATAAAILAGLVGMLFAEIAEFNLRFDAYMGLFWILAGLAVALPRVRPARAGAPARAQP